VSGFTEMVTSNNSGEPQKSYRVNWTCEVIGTERVAVMAGQFDTWKIACKRYNNSKNHSRARVKETRTWNYAPEIEHFVLTERQNPGRKAARRLELLAVLPPLSGLSDVTRHQRGDPVINDTTSAGVGSPKSAGWTAPITFHP